MSTYSRPDGETIGEVNEVHDLGILMAKVATFHSDIEKFILKSMYNPQKVCIKVCIKKTHLPSWRRQRQK